ncbi:MAG TPA: ABC transporter substrate-binding protein [Gemmatimonadaceae bacterium]
MRIPETQLPFPRHARLALAAVAAAMILASCGRFADKDEGGEHAERIVSVSKQLNEMMYAIGADDDIVAVDLSSIYPPAIRELPTVGYHRALSAEGIISMKPTVFLTDGNVGPEAVLDQLKKVGIPIEEMKPGSTLDSAQLLLTQLGKRFHRERAADSVLAAWKDGMAQLWADTLQWTDKKKPRVLIMHFGRIVNDYLAINRGSVADQMLRWAGGQNAMDSVGGMRRLTPETIARAAPDVIIATNFGFDRLGSIEKFREMPGIALTPAGKSGRIYRIEEQQIIYFGPRTPATIRELHKMIHP